MEQIRMTKVLSGSKSYWIEVSVRARGDTLASSVQSDAFHYPIQLFDGFLGIDTGACTSTPVPTSCTPGQDGFVKCCENAGQLVCL
jgi:hypothetical protein